MNAIIIERENRIKSGISTTIIVIFMALILWLYKVNIGMPTSFLDVTNVEMIIEPAMAGGNDGRKGNINNALVPVETSGSETSRSIEETIDQQATKQEKTPEIVSENPVDQSLENMLRNREKIRNKTEKIAGHNNGKGDNDYKGSDGVRKMDKTGPGVSNTFNGRYFIGGSTSTDCHQSGKVVLEVQLLPNGKIIFIDVDPATNGSDCLVKAAREILKSSSFNESTKPVSNGTITFIFKLN
jgi:hypothetical protein